MPESIGIAAFVFGAVLLLLAFVGGNFKIFGAELSRTAGPIARTIAGVLGLALIVIALGQLAGQPAPDDDRAAEKETVAPKESEAAKQDHSAAGADVVETSADDAKAAVESVARQGVEAMMDALHTGSIASRGLFQDDALLMLGELARVSGGDNAIDMSASNITVDDIRFTDPSTATATVSYVTAGTMTMLGQCFQAPPAPQTTAFMLRLERGRWRIHNLEFVRTRDDGDLLPC